MALQAPINPIEGFYSGRVRLSGEGFLMALYDTYKGLVRALCSPSELSEALCGFKAA